MTDRPEIRHLDATTIERIAAGEVVERPASVVKELVENSIDADASRITVTVEQGGKAGIHISDDGVGMTREAVELAVQKHTTSKIRDSSDLEAGIGTLGFRGEALHVIGAVARLTIRTKPRGGETGTELAYEGGSVEHVKPAGCPEGTTIDVADLFYNTPARKKYLKQDSTEFAHVNTVVTQYALANPDIAVTLEHNGREVFSTTGQGSLEATLLSVYGREVAKAMLPVEQVPPGPLADLSGVVSHPETTRSSAEYVSTYVNGRYVTSKPVRDAVVEAYGSQIAPDRYPFAVLFLDVPPETVDVNVHPRKMEVRFGDDAAVREQVKNAVEGALMREGLVRTAAPRGRSAPEQTEIVPETSGQEDTESPGVSHPATRKRTRTRPTPSRPEKRRRARPAAASRPATDESSADEDGNEGGEPETADSSDESTRTAPARRESADPTAETPTDTTSNRKFRDRPTQQTLSGERTTGEREFDRLPALRVLGQLDDTYIVAETAEGMVLVDQHAADERVNYERLREQFLGDVPAQALASPVSLELTAREAELFADYEATLAELGFEATLADDRTVRLTAVPSVVAGAADPALLRDVLSEFVDTERPAETVDAVRDHLLADLACYPSITGNTSLTEGSVVDLLAALDACENPYACPHGRPVVIEISSAEIENRFERDYPGHAGRREE
ncbi:DNA mismatch repair endonuclease MutL [Haladaptatus sp. DYSN1]|uniref:DNA mismatch repair endonuclease MutL n=1 Tax=unclassified Haladaptatus TaxID=2622732 RepID=UPI00240537C7|nr:DNA mismatch repair endonuclease MutL [Haladaptatus sp. DYSN1]